MHEMKHLLFVCKLQNGVKPPVALFPAWHPDFRKIALP